MKKTVELPLQMRLASLSTLDAKERTVRMVWSTGASVRRYDFWRDEEWIEELALDAASVRLDRLNGGAPMLNTHSRYDLNDIIGITEKAWVEDGKGMADVRFSKRENVAPIWQDVQDGIIRNVSVGYKVHRFDDVSTKEDVKAKVRRMRAVDWEPMEVSLVPIGADAGAGLRAEREKHPCEIEFAERSAEAPIDQQAGQAAPPAQQGGGVSLTLLRLRLELAERELHA